MITSKYEPDSCVLENVFVSRTGYLGFNPSCLHICPSQRITANKRLGTRADMGEGPHGVVLRDGFVRATGQNTTFVQYQQFRVEKNTSV